MNNKSLEQQRKINKKINEKEKIMNTYTRK